MWTEQCLDVEYKPLTYKYKKVIFNKNKADETIEEFKHIITN